MKYKTEQEQFWAGDFGNDYSDRNSGTLYLAQNVALFLKSYLGPGKLIP